jgi:hypothetical protein
VQQLAAALDEFERLSHDHSREGSALLGRANKPGSLFAEAAEQAGKGAAGSSAAGVPSAAAASGSKAAATGSSTAGIPTAAAASGSAAAAASGDVEVAADDAAAKVTAPPVAAANTASSSNVADRKGGLDRHLGRHVNMTAPPAAADNTGSAADRRGGLDKLLGRHVNTRLLHMISLHMLIANTLTSVQLAHMLVSTGILFFSLALKQQ